MAEKSKIFTVVIGDAPYTKERPYTMLRFVLTALLDGHKVNVFLVEDGIFAGKRNQEPANYDNIGKWMADIIEEGARVEACSVCMKARGVSEDELMVGITPTTMHGFVDMCAEADNILFS